MTRVRSLRQASPTPDEAARFDIANRLFFRLYQASNLMHKTGTKAVGEFGTTTQQWAVLGALARPGPNASGMSVKALMEYLMVSRQSLTAVLDRLEASGLIERIRAESDGRLRHVRMTSKGTAVWQEMLVAIRAYYAEALVGFSTQESLQLMELLDRLRSGLAKM